MASFVHTNNIPPVEAEAGITESPYYWVAGAGRSRPSSAAGGGDWVAGRSRSLPRHLDRGGYSREDTADPDDRLLFYLFSKKSVLMQFVSDITPVISISSR